MYDGNTTNNGIFEILLVTKLDKYFLFFPLYTAIKMSDWREGKKKRMKECFKIIMDLTSVDETGRVIGIYGASAQLA